MYKRILIATAGTALSRTAIEQGVALARLSGATIIGCHVTPPVVTSYGEPVRMPPETEKEFLQETELWGKKCLEEIAKAATKAGVSYKLDQPRGPSPAEALLDIARKEKYELIVMASHGRRGLAKLLLGSETTEVLTRSHVPVLITR
jgi:nucleotide-binding universal stress UspA family protein